MLQLNSHRLAVVEYLLSTIRFCTYILCYMSEHRADMELPCISFSVQTY